MQAKPQDSLSIQISGIVQGVGCRPAIKRLADKHRLRGWVRNSGTAVQVYVRGEQPLLQRFYTALVETFPQQTTRLLPHNFEHALSSTQHAFVIEPSLAKAQALAITPDLALCSACLAELLDKNNRRYRYPFISCTQCGPRYSISISAPFDRERTALKAFAPCSACSSEYTDPQDRRYHAQTIACH
ncbi:MAG: carbamoyltransferase HypF, partial [Pseudomonadales bacterium]|nr:carbamoyltransferase HypF [Pseudomonadales bacterium]